MFLHFGYMDEGLCTPSDLRFMYNHCEGDFANPEVGVFTFWQWLLEIYKGNRLPSRNEFDVDYETFVHEQKVKNQITAAQETAALKDRVSMVKYEIRNLFPVGNKVTFGHITIYCPVFSSHNVVRKLQDSLITTSALRKRIDEIREVDYQLFYRESVYSNEKLGINSEYVNTEVLPDFILMPNAGSRALMWQEIQGRVRTTHARMILPVFDMEDYKTQILHLCGDYRWEMCKRIQGPRYNDVTDPSLTSEFFDYVQFYRKNHDLSPEAKERVKMNLSKAKNSFKEMFVMDYMLYVAYEVGGSPRLNKVSREILMKYCPFPSETRRALAANPTFKDNIERYEMKLSAKIKRAENLVNKIQNAGAKVPDVIYSELEYLKK